MKHSDKDQRHKGEYGKFPNHVEVFDESGKSLEISFEVTSPFETPMKMQELIFWTKEQLESKSYHPFLIIGISVVVLLAIYSFQDDNGRLSRIFTTLLLLEGYLMFLNSS